jgi:repressor LexA
MNCPRCGCAIPEPQAKAPAPLTKKQATIVRFLDRYIREHNHAPSFEEIAAACGYTSLATVHEHLTNLERKRVIRRSYNESRAIELLVRVEELGVPSEQLPVMEVR